MTRQRSNRDVWRTPVLLGLVSAVGLITALLSDSWGDWISWICLAAVCIASLQVCVRGFGPGRNGQR